MTQTTLILQLVALVSAAVAVFAGVWFVQQPHTVAHQQALRYLGLLDQRLRQIYVFDKSRQVAAGQAAVVLLAAFLGIWRLLPPAFAVLIALAAAAGPLAYLGRERRKRIASIDAQIPIFLTSLANALRSTPSLTDALLSLEPLTASPLREELAHLGKEMRLGSTLDDALRALAGRVESRALDSAVSAILVGRQVGGDVAANLLSSADTMREMERLEGVVRTKTAEGKGQLRVLTGFPVVIVLGFGAVSPGYFDPLTQSLVGYAIAGVATILCLAAVLIARKILQVDL